MRFGMSPFRRALKFLCVLLACGPLAPAVAFSQPDAEGPAKQPAPSDLECVVDMSQQGIPLPRIFYPGIDLSGRGYHADVAWPQTVAAPEAIGCWEKDIGFRGMYRLQFNLWQISELEKNKELQVKLIRNYETIIEKVNAAGGTVILDMYSTPQGEGKVLDKTSWPVDPEAFKQLIKEYIRHFSVIKRYNIWYEVWSAPDLDDFFLGKKNEYLALYRCVAEAAKELQYETHCIIPVGGPSTSWWFRSFDESTILTPERSLIYELIKFCYHYKLPLDFISWHAYSTDPKTEMELTSYNKRSPELIRDWLGYFGFPRETPLIVDEWNFDSGLSNVLPERQAKANVGASYLVSRLRSMYESGLDYQVFFSLEDFQENKEGVVRNVGAFWYQPGRYAYTGGSKNIYTAFRMLRRLEGSLLPPPKTADDFGGVIATRGATDFAILAFDYADPEAFRSAVSRKIGLWNDGERASLLSLLRSDAGEAVQRGETDVQSLRLSGKVKNLLKKAQEQAAAAKIAASAGRRLRLTVKNMPGAYVLQRYALDDGCAKDCAFLPVEEKELVPAADGTAVDTVTLKPYSVVLIRLSPRPVSPSQPVPVQEQAPSLPPAATVEVKEAAAPAPAQNVTQAPAAITVTNAMQAVTKAVAVQNATQPVTNATAAQNVTQNATAKENKR